MRIGLWNLEPEVENTALMQVSQYHKEKGDSVEFYSPLFEYDKVYVFSLFSFTKKPVRKSNMITGGTGFDVTSRLPLEIETSSLDYSIYPNCKTSYIWFSRGCIRNCLFCVVPTKEGSLTLVQPKNLNPKATRISVMDNTFTALPKSAFYSAIDFLHDVNLPVDFQCGIDNRIVDFEKWAEIKKFRIYKQIRTAWDNPKDKLIAGNLKVMGEFFGKSKLMVYVLIGYWSTPEEDLYRVEKIREVGLDAWVMPFNKKDPYQKAFERWNNRHANCPWEEYKHGSWQGLELPTFNAKTKVQA